MKKVYCLPALIFLIFSSAAITASAFSAEKDTSSTSFTPVGNLQGYEAEQSTSARQVTLTLYVLDGGVNGPLLPGVAVTALDVGGNVFKGITDSNGYVVIKGKPGTWQLTLSKQGYKPISSNYDVTTTHAAATYLNRITQAQEQVALTLYVREGNLTGPQISSVQVTGQDAAGDSFSQLTNSYGSTVIGGVPGTWQFILSKEGYKSVNLNYNVTMTQVGAVYLQKIVQAQEQVALTIYVHDGNLTGPQLPDVQVAGQDAAGNNFSQLTNLDGSTVINGQPGTWQFTFSKVGYLPVILNYNVTETTETAAYLQRITI
jgi:hypothetical protein